MKTIFSLVLVIILLSFKIDDPKPGVPTKFKLPKGVSTNDYLPNTVILKFKPAKANKGVQTLSVEAKKQLSVNGISITKMQRLFENSGISSQNSVQQNPQTNARLSLIYQATFEGKQDIVQVINYILTDSQIEYAEPSYIYHTSYTPNDPALGTQNYLAKVQAQQAWDVLRNANGVVIGIVDSGSDLDHEDLASNIFLNNAETPGNGIDDDGDGYIDNYYGWDLVGNSSSTMTPDNNPDVTSDTTDHGVHVSGIAGAVADNAKGVASVAFNAKLLIVKTGADDNGRTIYKGYEGIKYAADHGAQIINCSWGGPGGGQFGQDIIDYAVSKGCLVVGAAGNDGTEEEGFPASYDGVLSVAATEINDSKTDFSNFNYKVDIAAPGRNIYNTLNANRYGYKSGTSMAAPLVASAAALVKAKYPQYSGEQIGELLKQTADPIDNVNIAYSGKIGKGRLNVFRALTENNVSSVKYQQIVIADQSNGSRAPGTDISIAFDLKNFLAPVSGLNLTISSTSPYVQVIDNTIAVGNLGTLETKESIGPVKVRVLSNAPQNQEVTFLVTYTGNNGAYVDTERFNVTVALDYLNITVNQISSTLSSNGRIGFSKADATGGLGFIYKNENMLYEASLLIGKSATQVANNARSKDGYNEDFNTEISAKLTPGSLAAFEGSSTFNDQGSNNPINLKVKSTVFASATTPDDKYIIATYELFNTGNTDLTGIYTGLFTDWDLDDSGANATQFDLTNKLAYVYAKKNANYPYAGVKLLDRSVSPAYYPLTYQLTNDPLADEDFSIADKYKVISSGVKALGLGNDTQDGYDVMFTIGSGPYTIPLGKSIKVSYAFIGGDNLSDLQQSAVAAQAKYDTGLGGITPVLPEATAYMLKQNYPNEANQFTHIPFTLPEKATTSLTISDIQGRVMQTVINNQILEKGTYDRYIDLSKYNSGIYLYSLKAGSFKKTMKMIVVK